jgi:PEP-CTERM motif
VTNPEASSTAVAPRRRRTRRHRRNRLLRHCLVVFTLGFFAAAFSMAALRHFGPSLFRSASARVPDRQQVEASRTRVLLAEEALEHQARAKGRPVYPYSIVAGGVENARELKWVAEHDPVVAAHYAGFDYDRARVVRLELAKTVYLSYRIGNHVYWTRRRVTLRKGEKLITDGKMTGRTRCANRVEEVSQPVTSAAEPPAAKFDEPMRVGEGTAIQGPPVEFQSALLNRPGVPEIGPGPPSSLYSPFYGGNYVPLAPPPLGAGGVCGPGKKKKKSDGDGDGDGDDRVITASGKKGKGMEGPCGGPEGAGGTVPEPGTFLLVASGLAAFFWQARRKLGRVPAV